MNYFGFVAAAIAVVLVFLWGRRMFQSRRRSMLTAVPFPDTWKAILEKNVSLYRHIPHPLRAQLHDDIQIFLGEKRFEGCGGLEITEEIVVTIAGQACMLLLNRENRDYPGLSTILVYPGAYVARQFVSLGDASIEDESVRAGESWTRGVVVLAWDHVRQGAMDFHSGHNVVLHEFAHQLDQEDGRADGAPILEKRSDYVAWARILGREYENLRDNVQHHGKSIIDEYGALNPAEFFAVATETFFEKPKVLKKRKPELYDELKEYYRVDPAQWFS